MNPTVGSFPVVSLSIWVLALRIRPVKRPRWPTHEEKEASIGSVPMPMRGGPDGAGPRGLSRARLVSEDDRPNYCDEHRESDCQHEEGNGAEPAAATVLIPLTTLPVTSLFR